MRQPSRRMPPSPTKPMTLAGKIALALFGLAVAALFWSHPLLLVPLVAVVAWGVVISFQGSRRLAQLSAQRPGESICTFARSFDYRTVDTWAIRAVFEELQPCCRFKHGTMPLRATDNFDHDLRIDGEELDAMAEDMAFRAGRSMENTVENPLYGKVSTVSDLVLFLVNQPRRKAA